MLILFQIGLPLEGVNYIMGCLSLVNFALLINGSPTHFFTASRGIRQGCPLSPLLFILVIEGLSLLIEDARRNGMVKGVKISKELSLTHLLFVDDVILFGTSTYEEWIALKVLLDTFCEASGMLINAEKSCFLINNIDDEMISIITYSLPYKTQPLSSGFKYLIYFIKPSGYLVKDWFWLLKKFEHKISHWSLRLLSLGGRLVPIKFVLTSIPVFWMELVPIPKSILGKLKSLIFYFLWGSKGNMKKFHLVDWFSLSKPTAQGVGV